VDTTTGQAQAHINPFSGGSVNAANTFVSGPLTADDNGNIYYNVIELNINGNPWNQNDVANAWLVKVTPNDSAATVTFATLVPNTPPGTSTSCEGTFFNLNDNGASLPWPPPERSSPPSQRCGSQRPGVNVAPEVAPDGTVYTVSVAHFDFQVAYVIAVNPDLTPKWASTLHAAGSLNRRLRHDPAYRFPRSEQQAELLPLRHRRGSRSNHQCERIGISR
jgi:hypothetical protein